MSMIDDKTKIPLAWAMGIILSLAETVSAAAVDQYRIGALEDKFKDASREQRKHDDEDNKRDIAMTQVIDKLKSIDETLKDMKDEAKEGRGRIPR